MQKLVRVYWYSFLWHSSCCLTRRKKVTNACSVCWNEQWSGWGWSWVCLTSWVTLKTGGGYIAPIIIPATPNSELAKEHQKVADKESDGKISATKTRFCMKQNAWSAQTPSTLESLTGTYLPEEESMYVRNKSGFIAKHQKEKHNSEQAEFKWKVVKMLKDPLTLK